ncbi:hypothetical protein FN846DRAFT_529679 [Sphaerosporella brunnea]|nr:hypothetical protein FN846DRAFT_529679 [Sphaerosporella brunnea]
MVEDVLYAAYDPRGPASVSSSIRRWVLDLSNPHIQQLFSTEDWEAIKAEVPPLADLNPRFEKSLMRFDQIHTIEQLREAVENPSHWKKNVDYDYDSEWAHKLMWHLLILFEQQTLSHQRRSERWYDTMIWSGVVVGPGVNLSETSCYLESSNDSSSKIFRSSALESKNT